MSRPRPFVVVPLVLLLTTAVACGDDGATIDDGRELEGVTWILDRGSIDGLADDVPPGARVDVRFEANEVSGTSGCNSYSGTYEVDGGSVSFGPLGGTEMGCQPSSLMELEAAYLSALGQVRTFRVSDDALTLTGGGAPMTFVREIPPEPLPLVSTRWVLDALGYGGDTVASPVQGTDAFIRFAADGSASGSTGCNRFGATYAVDGDAISIGGAEMTLVGCEPAFAEQEDVFQRALFRSARFTIEADVLTLFDADGGFLVSFRGTPAVA